MDAGLAQGKTDALNLNVISLYTPVAGVVNEHDTLPPMEQPESQPHWGAIGRAFEACATTLRAGSRAAHICPFDWESKPEADDEPEEGGGGEEDEVPPDVVEDKVLPEVVEEEVPPEVVEEEAPPEVVEEEVLPEVVEEEVPPEASGGGGDGDGGGGGSGVLQRHMFVAEHCRVL